MCPHCLSALGLHGPSCSAVLALADPMAIVPLLLVSLRPTGPLLLGTVGFGRPHGPRALATHRLSAYTAPSAPQHRHGMILRPSWPLCLYPFGLYCPRFSAPSASADPTALLPSLFVSLRPLRPQLLRNLVFGMILRPLWARCLSPLSVHGPSCSIVSASADPTALVPTLLASLRPIRLLVHRSLSLNLILGNLASLPVSLRPTRP